MKEIWWLVALCAIIIGGTLSVACVSGWYSSGIQADAYERQGVKLSQWEVFWGAKPIKILEHNK